MYVTNGTGMTYRLDALVRDLEGIRTALLDTSTCVYFLSEAQPWLTVVRAVLERADRGSLQLFIPSIVQMELLVRPFRSNDELERRKVETFVERTPFVRPVPFDRHVMMASAAECRRALHEVPRSPGGTRRCAPA